MLAREDSLACGFNQRREKAATIENRQKRKSHDASVKMEVLMSNTSKMNDGT